MNVITIYDHTNHLKMTSFDSHVSSITVPSVTCEDDFYDFSEFEPISTSYFSHYGYMPMVKVVVEIPVAPPISRKPKRQTVGCRYAQPYDDDQSS